MSTRAVNSPRGVLNPFPFKASSNGYKTNYSSDLGKYLRAYGKAPVCKASGFSSFLNIFTAIITPLASVLGLVMSFKMNKDNAFFNKDYNLSGEKETEKKPEIGDEKGAQALNNDYVALSNADSDKTKLNGALKTVKENKSTVEKYSKQLLGVAQSDIKSGFDTDGDGTVSTEEFKKSVLKTFGKEKSDESLNEEIFKTAYAALDLNEDGKIDSKEYATYLANIDGNSDGKIKDSETEFFGDFIMGSKSKEEAAAFTKKSVLLNAILFKAESFEEPKE